MSTEFKREARYTVFKGTDVAKLPEEGQRQMFLLLMRAGQIMECAGLAMRQCLVIESDWPEYEPAWLSIESRVTGRPISDGFSAGDMADQGAKAFAARDCEVERLRQTQTAFNEWVDKSQWARKGAVADELGMHLADVIKQRFNQLQADLTARDERIDQLEHALGGKP